MPNYQLSKIYKIQPLNPDHESDVYVGSTCKAKLSYRMASHKGHYLNWKKGKPNKITVFKLFEKYGVENCNILLLESFPCLNKDELRQRECYYIKNIPCVNKNIPGRTVKQYRDEHKEHIKQYRDNHKEHLKQYSQTKFKCICGGCYARSHKSEHYKTLKHINYMTKHDDIIKKFNDLIISVKQLKPICSKDYLNI
jgi:hypothetical protein